MTPEEDHDVEEMEVFTVAERPWLRITRAPLPEGETYVYARRSGVGVIIIADDLPFAATIEALEAAFFDDQFAGWREGDPLPSALPRDATFALPTWPGGDAP